MTDRKSQEPSQNDFVSVFLLELNEKCGDYKGSNRACVQQDQHWQKKTLDINI